MWRLEGATFSAVLPFPGRFLVAIGREDVATVKNPELPQNLYTHIVEVEASAGIAPAYTLHTRD